MTAGNLGDRSVILILYQRYRYYIIPTVVIIVSIVLIFKVIIPQYIEYQKLLEEERVLRQKNNSLEQNIQFLTNIDDGQLNSNADVLTQALPIEKDYVGVLTSITSSARRSGVKLDDYSFLVGKLATEEAKTSTQQAIKVSLVMEGEIKAIQEYIKALSQSFPLSDVVSVETREDQADVVTQFYYRALDLDSFKETDLYDNLDTKDKEVLHLLSSWKNDSGSIDRSVFEELPTSTEPLQLSTESAATR